MADEAQLEAAQAARLAAAEGGESESPRSTSFREKLTDSTRKEILLNILREGGDLDRLKIFFEALENPEPIISCPIVQREVGTKIDFLEQVTSTDTSKTAAYLRETFDI